MNSSSPKISVIMPFYNCEKYLEKSLESILNQTFTDFELILINDASTDNSDNIVQRYLSDSRLKYVKNDKNKKIVANLNLGLKLSKAEIIARMDGDDISELNRFEKQYNFLQSHPDIDLISSNIKIINEKSEIIDQRIKLTDPNEIKQELIIHSSFVHPATMFRKSVILEAGGYRQEYVGLEDLDLWYRVIFSGHKGSNIPEFLLNYRVHDTSIAKINKGLAWLSYKCRLETIKKFNLKPRIKDWIFIYIHLITALILPGQIKQKLEGFYKSVFKK